MYIHAPFTIRTQSGILANCYLAGVSSRIGHFHVSTIIARCLAMNAQTRTKLFYNERYGSKDLVWVPMCWTVNCSTIISDHARTKQNHWNPPTEGRWGSTNSADFPCLGPYNFMKVDVHNTNWSFCVTWGFTSVRDRNSSALSLPQLETFVKKT